MAWAEKDSSSTRSKRGRLRPLLVPRALDRLMMKPSTLSFDQPGHSSRKNAAWPTSNAATATTTGTVNTVGMVTLVGVTHAVPPATAVGVTSVTEAQDAVLCWWLNPTPLGNWLPKKEMGRWWPQPWRTAGRRERPSERGRLFDLLLLVCELMHRLRRRVSGG